MTNEEAKKILEVLLFSSNKPLSINILSEILEDVDSHLIRKLLEELEKEYNESSKPISIVEVAGGFQITTDPYYAPWIRKLYKQDRPTRLTTPSLETLAIIAYRQPITRSEIEAIRGVNVEGVLHTLLERGLIRTAGKKDSPGRPILYATTSEFLRHFGLKSLGDLPKLKEFTEADIKLGQIQELQMQKGETDETERAT